MIVVALAAIVPIRSEARHASEQVSQLLKGEYAEVLKQHGEWLYIACIDDQYQGYVATKQVIDASEVVEPNGFQTSLL